MKNRRMLSGFTLVELLLVMGIFAILASLAGISYFTTYSNSNLNSAKDVLIADIKTAQSNAMSGLGDTSWDMNNTTALPSAVNISTTFSSNKFIFTHGTGEILNFIAGQNTITLSSGPLSHVVRLNQYGTIIGD